MRNISTDDRLSDFLHARRRLHGIAYRILDSTAEAEDLVQDVWLRWQRVECGHVVNAPAFLAVMTTRLAINRARALRSRRETHQEPVELADHCTGPAQYAERGQNLERALCLLLQRLTPRERAAYVLREAFNYPYLHIASLLGVTEVTSRQLVTRARKHLTDERQLSVSPGELRRLLAAFVRAAQTGEVSVLESIFAAEVSASGRSSVAPWSRGRSLAFASHHGA